MRLTSVSDTLKERSYTSDITQRDFESGFQVPLRRKRTKLWTLCHETACLNSDPRIQL